MHLLVKLSRSREPRGSRRIVNVRPGLCIVVRLAITFILNIGHHISDMRRFSEIHVWVIEMFHEEINIFWHIRDTARTKDSMIH